MALDNAGQATDLVQCEAELTPSYRVALVGLALLMGMGKGGVPGLGLVSMALNSLLAPEGCIGFAVAMVVPATWAADATIISSRYATARYSAISSLLPPTAAGIAIGAQLLGTISSSGAKLLVGSALLGILIINMIGNIGNGGTKKTDTDPDSSNGTQIEKTVLPVWFIWLIGVVGGFATILTNSMGPLLNVYLLALSLEPTVFISTRALFFFWINTAKVGMQLYTGLICPALLGQYYIEQGIAAALGVFLAGLLVSRISPRLFVALQYVLMTLASLKLLSSGLLNMSDVHAIYDGEH